LDGRGGYPFKKSRSRETRRLYGKNGEEKLAVKPSLSNLKPLLGLSRIWR